MKRASLLVVAAGLGALAGSFLSFWLEERRLDRQWISGRGYTTRVHR